MFVSNNHNVLVATSDLHGPTTNSYSGGEAAADVATKPSKYVVTGAGRYLVAGPSGHVVAGSGKYVGASNIYVT